MSANNSSLSPVALSLSRIRHSLVRYAFALLAVAAATALRYGLEKSIGLTAPFLTFVAVVMLVAIFAGPGPGIVATLLSAAVAYYLFLEPRSSFGITDPGDKTALALFLVIGAIIISVSETMRRGKAELTRSNWHLDLAQSIAQIGSWDLDIVKNVLTCSYETHCLFKLSTAAPLSLEKFLVCVHPEDRSKVSQAWSAALLGAPFDIEHRILIDNETRWVCQRAKCVFSSGGRPLIVSGTVQDVTERRRSEEKSKTASLYTRSLIEASLDPLVTISAEGKITDVNVATEKVTGVSRAQLIGSDFSNYFTEPEKARHGYEQVFAEGSVRDYPLVIRHVSGSLTDVLYNATVFCNEAGQVEGVFAAARDITARKKAEKARIQAQEELRKLNEELEARVRRRAADLAAANKELEAFASSVSHDLRAPLRHIDGFLTLLQKKASAQLDESARHYIDNTTEACRRLGQMIDELLQFSRLGRSEIHKQPVDLHQLVQKVRQELEYECGGRVVHWKVDDLPAVAADPVMLRQVLQNLLDNALKFTRTRSETEISVSSRREPDGNILISVRDNGVGFDMQYCGKLFQVFQRLHHEDEFEGTGIGLANVRRMVERHGGRVGAEGALDRGATFYFSLPPDYATTGADHELAKSRSTS